MRGIIIVGKDTVGKFASERLGACFLPNHSLSEPADCAADVGAPAFSEMVRKVRAMVFDLGTTQAKSEENAQAVLQFARRVEPQGAEFVGFLI